MATTINSGYGNSPKLTANIADHADVYGGRALVFDGVVDYLQASVGYTLTDATFSLWFNKDTSHTGYIFNIYESTSSGWGLRIASNDVGIYDDSNANDAVVYNTGISSNIWYHIAVTISSNEQKLYLNGELKGSGTNIASSLSGIDGDLFIGSRRSDQQYFDGSMCDFKIFDTALTEAQVQELYKKPENTPSAVQNNLVAWYPMIEGNPESPQSIVYDHSEKKLGSELVTNGTFDSNIDNWSEFSSGRGTASWSNGRLRVDETTGVGNYYSRQNQNFYAGKVYKLSVDVFAIQGTETALKFIFGTTQTHILNASEYKSGDTYTAYLIPTADVASFLIGGNGLAEINELDNISVKEVLMGNHATTNFFGDELVTNGTFDSNTTGWSGTLNAILSSESGGQSGNYLKVLTGSSDNPTAQATETVEAGKEYYFSFYHKDVNSSNDIPQYAIYDVSNSAYIQNLVNVSSAISSSSWVQQTNTFITPSGCTSILLMLRHTGTASDNSYFGFDTVSLKEVGISSSGFETAVNEPVVPQVPLMRYNQKMKFKTYPTGTTGQYVDVDIDSFSLGDFTISFWYNTNNSYGTFIGRSTNSTIRFSPGTNTLRIGSNNYYISASAEIVNGRFLTATREGTSFKLYVDGMLDSTTTVVTDAWTFGTDARIGQSAWGNFDGTIHECSVFNTALTQAEIQELFNDGVALDATTHSKANDYLLGYWRNDGVTTWTDRSDIQAIGFDGVSNHSIQNSNSIGNALGDNYTGDLSISVWFKRTQIDISGGLVDIGFDPFDLGIFTLFINSSNELTFALVDNAWNLKEDFTDTDWNHVLAVYKAGSESDTKLYLNGSSVGTATGTFPSTSDMDVNGKNTYVGQYRSSGQSFTGIIGQTAIWTKELSSIEVSEIYNLGRRDTDLTTSYSTNLLAYYLLNPTHSNPDTTGSNNILDRSGNNHHATQQSGVNFFGTNDGTVQGSPDSITIREGLNSNRDGLGFYFTNPSSNVLRLNREHNEYLNLGIFDDNTWKSSFTVSFWIKLYDGSIGSSQNIMGTDDSSGADSRISMDAMYTGVLRLTFESEGTTKTLQSNSAIFSDGANDWKHISIVVNRDTDNGHIYVNDSEVASNGSGLYSGFDTSILSIQTDFHIGKENRGNNNGIDGLLDEVRIYNRALSADEITKNYKHQKGKHKND